MSLNLLETRMIDLEFEDIRYNIKTSLADPEDEWAVINGLLQEGEYNPSHSFSLVGVHDDRAFRFMSLIKEELERAKLEGVKTSASLDLNSLHQKGEEDVFKHELAHVEKAKELNLDLKSSTLRGFFTTSVFGLNISIEFLCPSNAIQKAQVALAPQKPSGCDFICARKK